MGTELSPGNAATLANLAYVAFQSDDLRDFNRNSSSTRPDGFVAKQPLIQGRTGITRVTNSSVVFDREVAGGAEKVVSIRGTQSGGFGQDWLTNINVGMVPGPNGLPCHAGFYFAYRSLREAVHAAIGPTPKRVHVVGHSLGGAQATLMAIDLASHGHDTHLYTFGAPRVGSPSFTYALESKLKGKIWRVYDPGDPVPMIPLFPFVHPPVVGDAYKSGENRNSISSDFHAIEEVYVRSAMRVDNWENLRDRYESLELTFGPADWLRQAGVATRIPGAGMGLWALGKALEFLLKLIGSAIQTAFALTLSTLDLLAWAILHAIDLGGQLKDWMLEWIQYAMRWLGREVIAPTANITRAFVQFLLESLFRAMATMARRALQRL